MQGTTTKPLGNNLTPNPKTTNQPIVWPPMNNDGDNPNIETKPDSETKPIVTKKKLSKLKTKVVHANDIKMFLVTKKKERDLKLNNSRENVKVTQNIPMNTPSVDCDSATLHPIQLNPLPHSASRIGESY